MVGLEVNESRRTTASACGAARLAAIALALVGGAGRADAQCDGRWLPTDSWAGVAGAVYAAMSWDPDGPGPLPARLVVGGGFTRAGSIIGNGIATWNGTEWEPLGAGFLGPPYGYGTVRALTVYNGELIAGGSFSRSGGVALNGVARWTGSAWQPLGNPGDVRALAVYNGELFAAIPAGVAHWDGAAWQTVGAPAWSTGAGAVYALAAYNGELVAAGGFTGIDGVPAPGIAAWNGSSWRGLGSIVGPDYGYGPPRLYTLAVYNGELLAGGTVVTPPSNYSLLSRWNGVLWESFGGGGAATYAVLTERSGAVTSCGYHYSPYQGGSDHISVLRWTGSVWSALYATSYPGCYSYDCSGYGYMYALGEYRGDVFVGGSFSRIDTQSFDSAAIWNGSAWHAMGTRVPLADYSGTVIRAVNTYGDDLVVGGDFTNLSGAACNRVGAWNGAKWRPLGDGVNNLVRALGSFQGNLIVGGEFTTAGGFGAPGVARWTGSAWQQMGAGLGPGVRAFAIYNGDLIASGGFSVPVAGGAASNIARWDGSAWQRLGSGLDGIAYDIKVYNGELIAGGRFTTAGGVAASHIARWNGSEWQPMGSGVNGTYGVTSLYPWNSDLLVGGDFTAAGGQSAGHVARWDGSAWHPMGTLDPLTTAYTNYVDDFEVYNGRLTATGAFFSIGGVMYNGMAAWDGAAWQPMGASIGAIGTFSTIYRGELVIGGYYGYIDSSGTAQLGGPFIGRWTDTNTPWVAVQPSGIQSACAGQPAVFHTAPALGYTGLSYRWRRAGQPLSDGPTPSGSFISGARTTNLTITNVGPADAASYDCVLSNTCGSATSAAATLSVCVADYDCNGAVEPADVATFVNVWFASLMGGTLAGDFDGNGVVNSADLAGFVSAWFAALATGC